MSSFIASLCTFSFSHSIVVYFIHSAMLRIYFFPDSSHETEEEFCEPVRHYRGAIRCVCLFPGNHLCYWLSGISPIRPLLLIKYLLSFSILFYYLYFLVVIFQNDYGFAICSLIVLLVCFSFHYRFVRDTQILSPEEEKTLFIGHVMNSNIATKKYSAKHLKKSKPSDMSSDSVKKSLTARESNDTENSSHISSNLNEHNSSDSVVVEGVTDVYPIIEEGDLENIYLQCVGQSNL